MYFGSGKRKGKSAFKVIDVSNKRSTSIVNFPSNNIYFCKGKKMMRKNVERTRKLWKNFKNLAYCPSQAKCQLY